MGVGSVAACEFKRECEQDGEDSLALRRIYDRSREAARGQLSWQRFCTFRDLLLEYLRDPQVDPDSVHLVLELGHEPTVAFRVGESADLGPRLASVVIAGK